MASFDVYSNPNYLDYLTVQQLESLLPAYNEEVDRKIRELIAAKRNLFDATQGLNEKENDS